MTNRYTPLKERAVEAGVSLGLAELMYDVARDAEEHGWRAELKEWAGDEDAMISLALNQPEKMAGACELLFATDGLEYMEGLRDTGITEEKRWELHNWIFGIEDEDELTVHDVEPDFDARKTALAISILRKAALREDSPSGHVCRQFLKACEVKAEIDFADLEFLDTEDSCALLIVFQGLLFDPGKTMPLLAPSNP